MKKLPLILGVVLLVAVVVLYAYVFWPSSKGADAKGVVAERAASSTAKFAEGSLPIAYVNIDSLLLKYDFSKEEQDKFTKKQESSRLTLTQKARKLEEDYMDFQNKLANNVYATRQRAEEEGNRIAKQQEELQRLEQQLTDEIFGEQQKVNMQLRDSLTLALKVYNADKKFSMILSNNSIDNTVLYSEEGHDITNDIAALLNERYAKAKK